MLNDKAGPMKAVALLAMAVSGPVAPAHGQENTLNKGLGFGFHVNQYQRDFGVGISLTSPYFLYQRMAVRARGNMMFNEHAKDAAMTWTPYGNASIGLLGVSGYVGGGIRLYGEGGCVALFPSGEFSSADNEFGGYGLFGFELHPNNAMNYFIEIGGVGTGAVADKLPMGPIYSNGLLIAAGMRVYLKGGTGKAKANG